MRITTVKELERLWEEYKEDVEARCREAAKGAVSYTVMGFCVYGKLSRRQLEEWAQKPAARAFLEHIQDECEVDMRRKFELGLIAPSLANLWMLGGRNEAVGGRNWAVDTGRKTVEKAKA